MMSKDEEEIKVIDRRHSSSGATEEKPKDPGFVMKDPEKSEAEAGNPRQIDFSTFIFSLATSALINLGLSPDPLTKKTRKDVALAKQNIDILAMIRDKTKGNLGPEENELLTSLLTEVRLRFVEATKK